MKAALTEAAALAPLVKKLWLEHSEESLIRILQNYIASEESAVFFVSAAGRPIAVALCCLRHDYVEGCETSPVGYLEGIFAEECFPAAAQRKRLSVNVRLGQSRWAERNLPATAS